VSAGDTFNLHNNNGGGFDLSNQYGPSACMMFVKLQ